MKEYKYISLPENLVTKSNKINESINVYFDIINQEAADGWDFVQVAQVNLVKKSGAFKSSTEKRNVFIFSKEVK